MPLLVVLERVGGLLLFIFFFVLLPSLRIIGPAHVGLITKRYGLRPLKDDSPLAFHGEAGYQARLLMPGWHILGWWLYSVESFPWVQVPAGEIGVVISQIGDAAPIGAKSGVFKPEFGNFADIYDFMLKGGQKGVQRPVLPPGTLIPIHPVGFLVITKHRIYGVPLSSGKWMREGGQLTTQSFGLRPEQLDLVRIEPHAHDMTGKVIDTIGIVTTYDGEPLASGDIASRLGGYEDVKAMEDRSVGDNEIIEMLLGNKNNLHNNYQDFQAFVDSGGKIGLQHDPLLYGAFALNPFLVSVEIVPMLVVEQGQVAVIKAYVGLPTSDVSGSEFKHGSLVRPGHRGIWQEPLRTGKFPINPRCYQAEIVPTAILTLNWADQVSHAHSLDTKLTQIEAKSREGFVFRFDLQVQIHVPDTKAPRVISSVGSMQNLVNEVLHAAVGNHFRDKLQSMPAVKFIETRQAVQIDAFQHISEQLAQYQVETKGVYIQDVILPEDMVKVLTQREIANQEVETYKMQRVAEEERVATEQARGTADMQSKLAQARVNVTIEENNAKAQTARAEGEAAYIRNTGMAKVSIEAAKVRETGMARAETEAAIIRESGLARGKEVEAIGLARAKSFAEQVAALGQGPTALLNIAAALSEHNIKLMPDILVTGGGGSLDGVAAALTRWLSSDHGSGNGVPKDVPAALPVPASQPDVAASNGVASS